MLLNELDLRFTSGSSRSLNLLAVVPSAVVAWNESTSWTEFVLEAAGGYEDMVDCMRLHTELHLWKKHW